MLKITSPESLEATIADAVRLKIELTQLVATKEAATSAVEKEHQPFITTHQERIAALESAALDYCAAHRAILFPDKKSRETGLAVFGFEMTPPRVEPASRKIKWKDVVDRLARLSWGEAYVRQPEPQPDKKGLLTDREKFTPEQLTAAGITFEQDEQFFIRPKAETAAATTQPA